jgi:hypothetical protein
MPLLHYTIEWKVWTVNLRLTSWSPVPCICEVWRVDREPSSCPAYSILPNWEEILNGQFHVDPYFFVFEGLTARHSSCPVCLSSSVDRFFLIQVIDVPVLTECTDLVWFIQANGKVFLSGLQVKHFWSACNECRMWDYLPMAKPVAVSHLGTHYNCCLASLLTGC